LNPKSCPAYTAQKLHSNQNSTPFTCETTGAEKEKELEPKMRIYPNVWGLHCKHKEKNIGSIHGSKVISKRINNNH